MRRSLDRPLLVTLLGPGLPTGDHGPVSSKGPCTPVFPLGECHWQVLSVELADHTGYDQQAFPGWRRHLKVLTGQSVSSGLSTTT